MPEGTQVAEPKSPQWEVSRAVPGNLAMRSSEGRATRLVGGRLSDRTPLQPCYSPALLKVPRYKTHCESAESGSRTRSREAAQVPDSDPCWTTPAFCLGVNCQ